jgi:hypothetical protein
MRKWNVCANILEGFSGWLRWNDGVKRKNFRVSKRHILDDFLEALESFLNISSFSNDFQALMNLVLIGMC